MRILILHDYFPPDNIGGAGIIAFNYALGLKKLGHEVTVITCIADKSLEGWSEYQGLKIIRLYSKYHERWRAYLSLYNPFIVNKVKKIIQEIKPDIVHAHNIHYHLSYHCLKLAKKSGAKVFLTAHDVMLFHYGKLIKFINPNDFSIPYQFDCRITPWLLIKRFKRRYNPFRNIIIRCYLKYVDRIFAVSFALKQALAQNGITNIEVMYNGIDFKNWQVDNQLVESFKDKYNLKDKQVVLFGGRLSEFKGAKQIILAIKEVVKACPKTRLLILGRHTSSTEGMYELVRELGIDNNIIFSDWLNGEELKAAYFSCDLAVFPSVAFETFGLVCLEAMASKKPVIATCFGGPAEVTDDGITGFIINPFDVKLMAEKIILLFKNQTLRERMGQAGYERAKKEFNIESQIKKLINYYGKTAD